MTLAQIVSWSALAVACVVVFPFGRRPERLGMTMIALGYFLTPFVEQRDNWYRPQFGLMAIDVVILVLLIVIAFRYGRYWPVCAAAFQAIAVLVHFAFMINPHALYRAYYYGSFSIGYLVLGAIIGGAIIERDAPIRLRPPSPLTRPSEP